MLLQEDYFNIQSVIDNQMKIKELINLKPVNKYDFEDFVKICNDII